MSPNAPNMETFAADYARLIRASGDKPFLVDNATSEEYTYAQFNNLVANTLQNFKQMGLQPGDRVAAVASKGTVTVASFLACSLGGMDFMPLSPQSTAPEVEHYCKLFNPKVIIGDSAAASPIIPASLQKIVTAFPTAQGSAEITSSGRESSLYIATSGSTGRPKVIRLSVDRLWGAAKAFSSYQGFLDSHCVFFNFYPMSYLAGLFNLLFIPMTVGAKILMEDGLSKLFIMRFWNAVRLYSVNVLWFTPTILHSLRERTRKGEKICPPDLATQIRAGFLGMMPIASTQKQEYEKALGFPLLENYGLTETTFISSESLQNRFRREDGYIGDILPWVETSVDAQTQELLVKTPFLYLSELDEVEGQVQERIPDATQGWKTGDQVRIDGQKLFFLGRLKNIIKKGGYLVSIDEIEQCLWQSSELFNCRVVGVPHSFHGECTVICLPEANHDLATAARARISENLARYKWPSYVTFFESFPLTVSGKIDRTKLASLVRDKLQEGNIESF